MKSILDNIVETKKKEVVYKSQNLPIHQLQKSELYGLPCISACEFLLHPKKTGIIAEFKRKSPSKGVINNTVSVKEIVNIYEANQASCVSVLTDETYFGGSIDDLKIAKKHLQIPVLRKDFIINEYDVYLAKSIGADFILLIAEILTAEEVEQFSSLAKKLGMEVLLEMHSESEIPKICDSIDIVGVNNRDLHTFEVNLDKSIALLSKLPKDKVKISESGIHSLADILKLKKAGFQGFLIGEKFMKEENPNLALRQLTKELMKHA